MRCLARAAILVTALGACAAATVPVASGAEHQRPRTERVSVTAGGAQANGESYTAGISADGRYATFRSRATDLAPGTREGVNLFIKDLRTGAVEQANVASDGTPADDSSFDIALSADGRFVAFASSRTDLVPGPSTDPMAVYVRDRWKGTTQRVSVRSDGSQAGTRSAAPVISADGSKVGFLSLGGLGEGEGESGAAGTGQGLARPRLDSFYVHDMHTGRTELAARQRDGSGASATDIGLSPDGRYALFSSRTSDVVPGKTTNTADVYARDLRTGVTRRWSVAHDGAEALGNSRGPIMSGDNRKVFFSSTAPHLIPGGSEGTDGRPAVYARDLHTGAVERLDVADDGTPADGDSDGVAVDLTGRTAVFTSAAGNLVPDDTDKVVDVLLRRLD
ncbi:hypothetical protein ABZ543_18075 [Streptomyces roseifaciens]